MLAERLTKACRNGDLGLWDPRSQKRDPSTDSVQALGAPGRAMAEVEGPAVVFSLDIFSLAGRHRGRSPGLTALKNSWFRKQSFLCRS